MRSHGPNDQTKLTRSASLDSHFVAPGRLDNAAGQPAVVSAGRQERLDWGLSRCLGGCLLGFLPDHSDLDLTVAGEAVFESFTRAWHLANPLLLPSIPPSFQHAHLSAQVGRTGVNFPRSPLSFGYPHRNTRALDDSRDILPDQYPECMGAEGHSLVSHERSGRHRSLCNVLRGIASYGAAI